MNTKDGISKFLESKKFDIRVKGNNPRFIDQKCTPDVISFIADMIIGINKEQFTRFDINNFLGFKKLTVLIFGKPSPNNKNLDNEYDKFVAQVLDMLAYAEILEKKKNGRQNVFKILESEMLEYISVSHTNAYFFLVSYLNKVLIDSGFNYMDSFFNNPNKETFKLLKTKFGQLMLSYSNIGTRGSKKGGITEIRRMFPKVLNPLSLSRMSQGTYKGRLSKHIITMSELVYNRVNFRDINKLKNVSRKEQVQILRDTRPYNNYQMNKAKEWVRRNHPNSEVNDDMYGKTAEVHHIFPRSGFPNIADFIENLIALTGGQHKDKAHCGSKTNETDRTYQYVCLKAKRKTIEEAIKKGITPYNKSNFICVLNNGFGLLKKAEEIKDNESFEKLDTHIDSYYKQG